MCIKWHRVIYCGDEVMEQDFLSAYIRVEITYCTATRDKHMGAPACLREPSKMSKITKKKIGFTLKKRTEMERV